jgi:hypothetical protein
MSEVVLKKSLISKKSAAELFAYFADFTTTNEWDPNTVKTTLISGDGGVGTRYHNVSAFNGKESEVDYVVTVHEPNSRFQVRGENRFLTAVDTMTIEETNSGARFTYEARFKFKGVARLMQPFLGKAFKQLEDIAEEGLRQVL